MSKEGMERRQASIYLFAIASALLLGAILPSLGEGLEVLIYPVLGALLLVTFMQVPFSKITESTKNVRFLGTLLLINFVLVPPIAWAFSLFAEDKAIQLGILMVLLVPCVDYVIVFTKMAGGDSAGLLAATPMLMLVQILLLPFFLWLFLGSELSGLIEPGPFIATFLVLIALPLALAWLFQHLGKRSGGIRRATEWSEFLPVPLMAATLFVVVASQTPRVVDDIETVAVTIPVFAGFILTMTLALTLVSRALHNADVTKARAVLFSGVTRNGLVVLPLALAMDVDSALTSAVIVTQVLVEVTALVLLVKLVPHLLPAR